jgi:hypothetical protein
MDDDYDSYLDFLAGGRPLQLRPDDEKGGERKRSRLARLG